MPIHPAWLRYESSQYRGSQPGKRLPSGGLTTDGSIHTATRSHPQYRGAGTYRYGDRQIVFRRRFAPGWERIDATDAAFIAGSGS